MVDALGVMFGVFLLGVLLAWGAICGIRSLITRSWLPSLFRPRTTTPITQSRLYEHGSPDYNDDMLRMQEAMMDVINTLARARGQRSGFSNTSEEAPPTSTSSSLTQSVENGSPGHGSSASGPVTISTAEPVLGSKRSEPAAGGRSSMPESTPQKPSKKRHPPAKSPGGTGA